MDLDLSIEQQLLDDAVRAMFADHAGHERAREMHGSVDRQLVTRLGDNGFLDVFADAGPIEAILVAERASAAVASAPIVARVLVGPLAGITDLPPLVGLVGAPGGLVRYAGHCDAYLVLRDDAMLIAGADDVEVEPVPSRAGYPMGRVHVRRAESLGPEAAMRCVAPGRSASPPRPPPWRSPPSSSPRDTSATVCSSAVRSARSRQCSIASPGRTRWPRRHAGWRDAAPGTTPTSTAPRPPPPSPASPARETYDNVHQVVGGIGVTAEYGMTEWTMRLLALHTELGGRRAHARRVAASRAAQRERSHA